MLVEVSRSPLPVTVALQLPDSLAGATSGGRLTDKVPSDTTLWLILRKFESASGANLNFTARGVARLENGREASGSGRMFYEMPVLNILGRELSTFADLQKTLAQLGLNGGNVLMRLSFRETDQPIEEAMNEIGQYFKEEEQLNASEPVAGASKEVTIAETTGTAPLDVSVLPAVLSRPGLFSQGTDLSVSSSMVTETGSTISGDLAPSLSQTTEEAINPTATPEPGLVQSAGTPPKSKAASEPAIPGANSRLVSIYAAPTNATPKAALLPHNESDFDASLQHVKLAQSRLQNNAQNKVLLPYAEEQRLEEEKQASLAAFKSVNIDVRFPDGTRPAFLFTAEDTAATLYECVREMLIDSDQPFKILDMRSPVPNDPNKKLIKNLGFKRAILLNFAWESEASTAAKTRKPVLKPEFAGVLKPIPVPQVPETKEDEKPAIGGGKVQGGGGDGEKKKGGKGMQAFLKGLKKN